MLGQISFPVNSSVPKKEIVVGGADDRKRMTDLDSDFRTFMDNTIRLLAECSDSDLERAGIEKLFGEPSEETYGYALSIGSFYCLIKLMPIGTMRINISASQYCLDEKGIFKLIFDFESRCNWVESAVFEKTISIKSKQKIDDGSYVWYCLPHPNGEIKYDKKFGGYHVSEKKEFQGSEINFAGSAGKNEQIPFISTDFFSFDVAFGEVVPKIHSFQSCWHNALVKLGKEVPLENKNLSLVPSS